MFNRWLRNRSFNIKVVRDEVPISDKETSEELLAGVEAAYLYGEITKDVVKNVAFTVCAAWCVYKVVERLCR